MFASPTTGGKLPSDMAAVLRAPRFHLLFQRTLRRLYSPTPLECMCGGKWLPELKIFAELYEVANSIFFYDLQPGDYPRSEFYKMESKLFFTEWLARKYHGSICACVAAREARNIAICVMQSEGCAARTYVSELTMRNPPVAEPVQPLAYDQRFTEVYAYILGLVPSSPALECTCGGLGSPEIKAFEEQAAAAGSIFFYDLQPGVFENAEFYEREAEPFFQKELLEKYEEDMCPCVALRESERIKHWTLQVEASARRTRQAELTHQE